LAQPEQTAPEETTVEVWEVWLASLLPISPLWMGVLLSAVLIAAFLGAHAALGYPIWVTGTTGGGRLGDAANGQIVFALLIGYTVAAGRYLPAAIARDLQEIGGVDVSELQVLRYPIEIVRRSRYAGVAGALGGLGIHIALNLRFFDGGPALWYPETAWSLFALPLLGWLLARSGVFTVTGAGARMQDSASEQEVDLLDLRPLYVGGRIGLRLALVWIIGCSIASLFLLHAQAGRTAVPGLIAGFAIAAIALVLPVRSAQKRIHRAKLAELALLDGELRAARDAVLLGRAGSEGRLADLLSYRSYVVDVREWPFDSSTFASFGLYLMIPVGSWLGGAFMERLLGLLLD
jgi:hypothetical protein